MARKLDRILGTRGRG